MPQFTIPQRFTHLPAMPAMPSMPARTGHRRHRRNPIIALAIFLFITVFWMAAATSFLFAVHRISRALMMTARADVLKAAGDTMTDEEKRIVAEYLRHDALRRL